MDEGHLGYQVRLTRPYGEFMVGSVGSCTADLPDEDVYAVWFEHETGVHPLIRDTRWVRFEHAAKAAFDVIGPMTKEVAEAMATATAAFRQRMGRDA